ncbi:MAG: K(+)-transporting ATPase subunit F [Myxococcales bacterium]
MLKKILFVAVLVLAGLFAWIASRPDAYRVSRSLVIAAAPATAYAEVADFHRWEAWSPWGKLDPAMKTTYGGTPGQIGSTYAWTGNDKVGAGRMTVIDEKPGERVYIRLEFLRPFKSQSMTTFKFLPAAAGTEATWTMEGKNDLLGKTMAAFADMDKMIGDDFERGLAQLKAICEARPR